MVLKDLVIRGPMPKVPRFIPKMKLEPTSINDENWFYDEKRGLLFVHEVRDGCKYIRTDQVLVPWRLIHEASRRRMDFVNKHEMRTKHGKRKN